MFEVSGRYGNAKVFTSKIDAASMNQVLTMLDQPFVEDQSVRMMPDIHAGAGCTIGTTLTVEDKICPNLTGVDISCGLHVVKFDESEMDFEKLDNVIRTYIPSGNQIHNEPQTVVDDIHIEDLACSHNVNIMRAYCSCGSLGSGNHFIEVDRGSDDHLWLVVHSGSRKLGLETANYYQRIATKTLHSANNDDIKRVIAQLKEEGREREIESTINSLKSKYGEVPDDLCWCEGKDFEDYVHDMKILQKFADLNRKSMAKVIIDKMGLTPIDEFTTIHNYLDTDSMILRKGAVSARSDERFILPMNMRDGSLICVGKGNADWNYSAPHGAGRLMSRRAAKNNLSLEDYEKEMDGIWSTSVSKMTLDEAPMAYKPMDDILSNIGDTAEIVETIKPVYNFKAS